MSVRGKGDAVEHDRMSWAYRVRLIVVESGTTGLVAYAATDGSDQTVVIAQIHRETPTELSSRVLRRILALERARLTIARTIVLLSPCYDMEAIEARLLVVRALVNHSASMRAECVELILSACKGSLDEMRTGWPEMVNALRGEPAASAATVRVKLVSLPLAGSACSSPEHDSWSALSS